MTKSDLERSVIEISVLNILGRGWGLDNAIPEEEAIPLLKRLGDIETVESNPNVRWRVTLDPKLKSIGDGSGGQEILVRDSGKKVRIGSIAYWGTTSIDVDKVDQVFGKTE